jgi:hypothetical protein
MPRPTIVLVHGAWADGPSWNAVAPDEGETVSQILSASGSALVPDPTTVLDLAGYPGAVVGTKDRVIPPETFLSVFNDRSSAPISIGVGSPFSSGGIYEHAT